MNISDKIALNPKTLMMPDTSHYKHPYGATFIALDLHKGIYKKSVKEKVRKCSYLLQISMTAKKKYWRNLKCSKSNY